MPPTPTAGRGRFVVLEGLDGAGTTTQAARLAARLSEAGIAVEVHREPTTGPLGAVLRQAIEGRIELDPATLALAFAADRADHLNNPRNGVRAQLERGTWVVCDRYVLSSLAYQASDDLDGAWLEQINAFAVAPDLTVFVDVDAGTSMSRIDARSAAGELFHDGDRLARVREAYHRVLDRAHFTGELLVVDGAASIDAVADAIWDGVREALPDAALTR